MALLGSSSSLKSIARRACGAVHITCLWHGAHGGSSRASPLQWQQQPQGPRRRQQARIATEFKVAVTRGEGDDNPQLTAWKQRAVSPAPSRPEAGATPLDSDDYSGPPEPPPAEDTLGPDQWRGGTAEQWEQFLRECRVRDCTFWDAQNVDQGFPPTHVDLEKE